MTDYSAMIVSLKLALASTAFLLLLAVPGAYILANKQFKGKLLLESLIGLPLVLPPTVLGYYLLTAMGANGPLGKAWLALTGHPLAFTFTGIVCAGVVHGLPFAVQPAKAAFERIDRRLMEMAQVMGLGPAQTFFKVALPNAAHGIAAAAVLVFAHAVGEFGVVLMVGGAITGRTKTASIAVYEYVENMQYREAAAMSLALAVFSLLVLTAVNHLNRGRAGGDHA